MRIINRDGSEAEMCGNGARCIAAYIVRDKKIRKKLFTIETLAGNICATATRGGRARPVKRADRLSGRYSAHGQRPPDARQLYRYRRAARDRFVDGLDGIDVAGIGGSSVIMSDSGRGGPT